MHRFRLMALIALVCVPLVAAAGQYQHFNVAIYIAAGTAQKLSNRDVREREYQRVSSQLKFDKVYLEAYRDRRFVDERALVEIKKFFQSKGVTVSGGLTLSAGGTDGQFGTFDYENPSDRAECQRAVELAARVFDEIILDDFFFYTSKSDADIAAKGARSWTQYRLDTMREVARKLVLESARAVNPKVKITIKYPNWYEHFQGLGYDLDVEAKAFDSIYTGTETRDPDVTDQLLQQYESYLIVRYFDHIRPNGGNRGGWVDTFSTRYVDRYAEQLWDTLFAKAPEITLFNWDAFSDPKAIEPGDRAAWQGKPTSFRWDEMQRGMNQPGWASAANYSLKQVDAVVGKLGNPVGLASYKPYQSSGEDFLQNYLGTLGIPVDLYPTFPSDADIVLLTESAKYDKDIVAKIKQHLTAGKKVVITSGLLRALQGHGIEDIAEIEHTGHTVALHDFLNGWGAGNGLSLNDPAHETPAILFPEIRFYTNDSWALIRGVASSKGFPILLMNKYSLGVFYVLAVPDNFGDLYKLPQPVTNVIRSYLQADAPVRIDAPPQVSLFSYDNRTFIVQSFRPDDTKVGTWIGGTHKKIRNLVTNETLDASTSPANDSDARRRRSPQPEPERSYFEIALPPHSYAAFSVE
jgi:hypothetical protein